MKTQMLDLARRPAWLRARQKTALSATGRDCFAAHQKPKRFAVRGGASPGCFARRRLPPTATEWRRRCNKKEPKQVGNAKYALPLRKLTSWCPRNSRAIFAQSPRSCRNLFGSFQEQSAFRAIRELVLSLNCPWHFRGFEYSAFMSNPRPQNVREQSATCPTQVCYLSNRLSAGSLANRLSSMRIWIVSQIPSKGHSLYLAQVSACWAFKTSSFASRVVFRASSEVRPNLSRCVVLSGIAGRVSGLMSSRAGRAHHDCLPLFTAPSNRIVCALPFCAILSFAVRSCVRSMKRLSLGRSSPWLVRVAWPADQMLIIGDRNGVSHGNSSPSRNAIS
jgi:hypothetical protein